MSRLAPMAPFAALALVAAPLGAAEPAKPSPEQMQHAARNFEVLYSAMEAKNVEPPIKNALFLCAYENSFAKISTAVDKVIAARKIAQPTPTQLLGIMAGVCGYKPQGAKPAPNGQGR